MRFEKVVGRDPVYPTRAGSARRSNSGEHTRLACWFRRLAGTIFPEEVEKPTKSVPPLGYPFRPLRCSPLTDIRAIRAIRGSQRFLHFFETLRIFFLCKGVNPKTKTYEKSNLTPQAIHSIALNAALRSGRQRANRSRCDDHCHEHE